MSDMTGIFRDNLEELKQVLIATPAGAEIPIGEVATISFFSWAVDDPR